MKKKIKDLTLEEIANICSTHHCFEDCPILDACNRANFECIYDGLSRDKFTFEQEIEVEDDD